MPTIIVTFISAVEVSRDEVNRGQPEQYVTFFSDAEDTISTHWRKGSAWSISFQLNL